MAWVVPISGDEALVNTLVPSEAVTRSVDTDLSFTIDFILVNLLHAPGDRLESK